ncbi:alpha-1,2-Mannosidase [Mycena kentingensis (nom. inval.)]|nr:alpha-1,2-Mannosidase [Mycena kentingensis (nom. inval.)]
MLPGSPERSTKLGLVSRNILRRYWPFFVLLTGLLWFSASNYAPRQYRLGSFLRPGRPPGAPRPPEINVPNGDLWAGRANEARKAFVHAYKGYQRYALPHDELKPMSGEAIDNFHGWGVTMYDSLDTMWLMGLEDMFWDTVHDVEKQTFDMPLDAPTKQYAHFFEVVIRYLGGILSAYALSEDPRLLRLADTLGEKLMPAFSSPSGWPYWGVHTVTGATVGPGGQSSYTCLAEALSNQMEFKYLAHITGKAAYYEATERPMDAMYDQDNIRYGGLYAKIWNLNTGKPNQTDYAIGGCADSAYEYFLKQWLMTGQREPKARDLYIRSANAIIEKLLYVGANRPLLYATDIDAGKPDHGFEHLSCFLPALFALGAHTPALSPHLTPADRERHLWAAEGLANTCWTLYADMESGLSPDKVAMEQSGESERGRWVLLLKAWEDGGREGAPPGVGAVERQAERGRRGYVPLKDAYLLRPETVETFYLMWRTTGDVKWRERGWAVFESLEKFSRVKYGYSSVRYLDEKKGAPYRYDDMPSWFMAETLKYLFLLFTDEDLVPLDKWVFNTEAHPFPVFQWSPKEVDDYRIFVE